MSGSDRNLLYSELIGQWSGCWQVFRLAVQHCDLAWLKVSQLHVTGKPQLSPKIAG